MKFIFVYFNSNYILGQNVQNICSSNEKLIERVQLFNDNSTKITFPQRVIKFVDALSQHNAYSTIPKVLRAVRKDQNSF